MELTTTQKQYIIEVKKALKNIKFRSELKIKIAWEDKFLHFRPLKNNEISL